MKDSLFKQLEWDRKFRKESSYMIAKNVNRFNITTCKLRCTCVIICFIRN